jgi:hypothetical protein
MPEVPLMSGFPSDPVYSKPRTHRSIPSRLNAVGPTKKMG